MNRLSWLVMFVFVVAGALAFAGCGDSGDDDDDDDDTSGDDDDDDTSGDDDDDDTGGGDDDDDNDTGDDDDDDDDSTNPAINLNGTDQWGQVPYNAAFELQNFTVECWFKYDTAFAEDTDFSPLVSIEERSSKEILGYGWRLFIVRKEGSDRLGFMAYKSDHSYQHIEGTTTLIPGTWYHAAGIYDGSEIRIYLDGGLEASEVYSSTIAYNEQPIGFGWPCWSGNCSFLDGMIDEVRISSSARYTSSFDPPYEHGSLRPDTVGLWHLNEGGGTTFFDTGANGFNGTLTSDQVWSTR